MAKKKAQEQETAEPKTKAPTDLVKKYGEQAFINGADFLEEPKLIVPVSPKLDMILGGGVPEGSFVIFAGPPKVGKTVTALHLAGNAQKMGKKVFFFNVEGRIKQRDIQGIKSLDPSKMEIIRSYKADDGVAKILLAHEYLEIAERRIHEEPGCVIIIDSASMLLTELEKGGELGQQHRAPGAVLLSQFCKRVSNIIPINGSIVIMIVHVVANTGGGHKKTSRTGGNKIQYAVDVDLEATYAERWAVGVKPDDPESGTQIGQKVHWKTGSTGVAAPGMKTVSWLRYGVGIDEVYELFELGKLLQLINVSGSWFRPAFLSDSSNEELKALADSPTQGGENFLTWLEEHPEAIEILRTKVKEFLG